jgi:fatty acid desaturase
VKEHRAIRSKLEEAGMFETRPEFYYKLFVWYAVLFAAALYFTLAFDCVLAHMTGAILLASFWQQLAFSGHDVGHNAITHNRATDLFWGTLVGNTFGGISLEWWKRSHNVHHIVCNSIENDPDIQHLPVMAVDSRMLGNYWSNYHKKYFTTDAIARFLVSYQHYMFYPIMALARFNLYVQGYIVLLNFKVPCNYRMLEIGCLGIFFFWNGLLLSTLSSWQEMLCYLLVSHAASGLLHVQITISHFAEDCYHGQAYNGEEDEWFKMQLKTTMNVDCPEWMDWFHGGLQFQIEHHLFPRIPRHNLRAVRDIIKPFAKKWGLHYEERSFIDANIKVVEQLRKTAMVARTSKRTDGGFYQSQIWDGLNAQG